MRVCQPVRGMGRPAAVVLVLVALVALPAGRAGAVDAGSDAAVVYDKPVRGRVISGFDPPAEPWKPGHRGVDLATPAGAQIAVAADGEVAFAGAVAGRQWVTVAHADGVRTTYGPLASMAVAAQESVDRGEALGRLVAGHGATGGPVVVHWSARRAGRYIDPMTLIGGDWRPALLAPGELETIDAPELPSYASWRGRRPGLLGALGFVDGSPTAEGPGWVLPPNPNHVIGVAGLGSSSDTVPLDLTHLGYAGGRITYLSYAGRRDTDAGSPDDPRRDQRAYGPADTFEGVHAAAVRLREQLRAHHAAHPGEAVDLVGHSMGGVVVAHYLLTMHDPSDPTLPPVGHVVTIASPLEGADLANAVRTGAVGSTVARGAMRAVGPVVGMPEPSDASTRDLAVGSALVEDLAAAWKQARDDRYAGPLATGTQVLTLGGSRDVVVPEHRSDLPDAEHVVLPGGHDGVRLTEASRIAVHAFLADQPVPGEAGGIGHALSYPLSWTERSLGYAVSAGLP